ncbi:hypothetical protein NLJ89_g3164 [Agrocybe chaxingu]|uniref:F-box domain-containing protein n=1 Tax=Agrocybe chaxingu TaxID=84603 RepID=A0A9W8MX37_9AGAR|nr:hypothetical protein NLJ89_g3164 [Agrocybe chaxingu]
MLHEDLQSPPSSGKTSPVMYYPPPNDDPRVELAAVEAEVTKVSMVLATLVQKTHVLKGRINHLHSPILRILPPELLSEIFQFCIPPFTLYASDEVKTFVPLLFGAVCSTWRRIAWSTPSLWKTLTLYLNTRTINSQIILLEEWLARSGGLPLSIRLHSCEDNHWAPPSTPGSAIETINRFASRWRDLDLRLPTSCYKYLPSLEEPLPLLDSLHLNPPGGQGERRHKVDMSKCAQIKHLSLSCVYLVSMSFQWDQVTELRLEAFYVDECLEALRQSPQVVSCSLRNIISGDDGHTLPEFPLLLSSLKTLSIENDKDTTISLLFDSILIPNAKELSYSGRNLIHVPQLCALISRSTSLHAFTLSRTTVSSENIFVQLLRALKAIPKIVLNMPTFPGLTAGSSPYNDNVLRLCDPLKAPLDNQDCLLPALEVFEYHGPQSFQWSILLETLDSRKRSLLPRDEAKSDGPQRTTMAKLKFATFYVTRRDANIPELGPDDYPRWIELSTNGPIIQLRIQLQSDVANESHTKLGTYVSPPFLSSLTNQWETILQASKRDRSLSTVMCHGVLSLEEGIVHGLLERTQPPVDDPFAELAALDGIIDQVEGILAKLVKRRAPLKSRINQMNSPINNILPPEILSHIFTFCLPDFSAFDTRKRDMRNNPMPLLLGSICQHWRDIAWATPALWNTFSLYIAGQDLETLTRLTEQWLMRSGDLPLHIRLSCEPKTSAHGCNIMTCADQVILLVAALNTHASRWRELDIRIPTYFFDMFHTDLLGRSMLEYLYIDPPDGQSNSAETLHLVSTPSLKRLHLSSVYLASVQVQWDSVTDIYASAFYLDECLEIFQRAPQLVSAAFPFIIGGDETYVLCESRLTLPALKHLRLGHERGVSISSLLDKISLPALEELSYDGSEKTLEVSPFVSLLTRSACPLRILTLTSSPVDEENIIKLLSKVPSLKKLSIITTIFETYAPIMSPRVLACISRPPDESHGVQHPNILPELEVLEYVGFQQLSWPTLLSAFERSPSLRTVKIRFHRKEDLEGDAELACRIIDLFDKGKMLSVREGESADALERFFSTASAGAFRSRFLEHRTRIRSIPPSHQGHFHSSL